MSVHKIALWTFSMYFCFSSVLMLNVEPELITGVIKSTKNSLTFAHEDSFLEVHPSWPFEHQRKLSFYFRTRLPNCLLAQHFYEEFDGFFMIISLHNGRIKLSVETNNAEPEILHFGKGLNKDKWHHIILEINSVSNEISIILDDKLETLMIVKNMNSNEFKPALSSKSIFFFGGVNSTLGVRRFVGCMKEIKFSHSSTTLKHVESRSFHHLFKGCYNRCKGEMNCLRDSKCINHYSHYTCDCFGTGYENQYCGSDKLTKVTLRGNEFISHRIFNWEDRVHSELNRMSITFQTFLRESILFYGHGLSPVNNYLGISMKDGKIVIAVNFGDEEKIIETGKNLDNAALHNLTISHSGKNVEVFLDSDEDWYRKINISENHRHHFHFNPEIYIGGTPSSDDLLSGLTTQLKYVGIMHSVYFNEHNVLLALHENSDLAHHHGPLPVQFGGKKVLDLPITFSFPSPYIQIPFSFKSSFEIYFDFLASQTNSILVSSYIDANQKEEYWHVSYDEGYLVFNIFENENKKWSIKSEEVFEADSWHSVQLKINNNNIMMKIDYRFEYNGVYDKDLKHRDLIFLGGSAKYPKKGFTGCMRRFAFNQEILDARQLVLNTSKGISLDDCQFVDPCKNSACEHESKCTVVDEEITCDCTGTGYIGKTCHFSIYNKSCEELYSFGMRKSGIYRIDIDRNGPYPPSYVYCDMDSVDPKTGQKNIITQISNNIPTEMKVWSDEKKKFKIDVTYRDMTSDMLGTLIQLSKKCRQSIKYDCFNSPLEMGTHTWFQSSLSADHPINSFGEAKPGLCQCEKNSACANGTACNCDVITSKHTLDEGYFSSNKKVGITEMYFSPSPNLDDKSFSTISLGPLQCVEAASLKHAVKFTSESSYLKLPTWKKGSLRFSFRTTKVEAPLFHQPSPHKNVDHLTIRLIKRNSIIFEFTINQIQKNISITLKKPLNDINWHHVSIDNSLHHIKFAVDHHYEFIDLGKDEEFGIFEGSAYLGYVPNNLHKEHENQITHPGGFLGCIQELRMNNILIPLQDFVLKGSKKIVPGCSLSCHPNPCQNDGQCKELWFDYECLCSNNVISHGKNCETDEEEQNGVTFDSSKSIIHELQKSDEINPIFYGNISLHFRTYVKSALILYANDANANFVQISLEGGNTVAFTFNHFNSIIKLTNKIKGEFLGQEIKVRVERGISQTVLIVNDVIVESSNTVSLLSDSMKWTQETEALESVKMPPQIFKPSPYYQYIIGGINEKFMSDLKNFIGCIHNLEIDDTLYDLEKADGVDDEHIKKGCHMLCDKSPCKNNGVCMENPEEETTTCICDSTSYGGETCEQDVGGGFNGEHNVEFLILNDAIGNTDDLSIEFAFSTDQVADAASLLLSVELETENSQLYILLTNDGHVLIKEILEDNEFINVASGYFNDGHRHWFTYKRLNSEVKSFKIDGKEFVSIDDKSHITSKVLNAAKDNAYVSSKSVIYIGGLTENDVLSSIYENFKGCISNIAIKFGEKKIEPLHSLYGYETSQKFETQQVNVKEESCAAFAPLSVIPSEGLFMEIPAYLAGSEWNPEAPSAIYVSEASEQKKSSKASSLSIVTIVLAMLLLIVLLSLAVYMYRINRRVKRRKFEDETKFFSNRSKPKDDIDMHIPEESYPLKHTLDEPDSADNSLKDAPNNVPARASSYSELQWDPTADNDAVNFPVQENEIDSETQHLLNVSDVETPNSQSNGSISSPLENDTDGSSYSPALPPKTRIRLPPPLPPKKDELDDLPNIDCFQESSSLSDYSPYKDNLVKTPSLVVSSSLSKLSRGGSSPRSSLHSIKSSTSSNELFPCIQMADTTVSQSSSNPNCSTLKSSLNDLIPSSLSTESLPLSNANKQQKKHDNSAINDSNSEDSSESSVFEESTPVFNFESMPDKNGLTQSHISVDSSNSSEESIPPLMNLETKDNMDENNKSDNKDIPSVNEDCAKKKFSPFSYFNLGKRKRPKGKKLASTPKVCHPLSPIHNIPTVPAPLPSFINNVNKQYDNPLTYLGGPHIDYDTDGTCSHRSSLKSVLSLD